MPEIVSMVAEITREAEVLAPDVNIDLVRVKIQKHDKQKLLSDSKDTGALHMPMSPKLEIEAMGEIKVNVHTSESTIVNNNKIYI